ncbi:MAG TPA: (Fe-S)-binding protein [Burkholderiaceae bacterium]|nr:(Fe-S)-binding protein [Burkholderiaceae bacterium]
MTAAAAPALAAFVAESAAAIADACTRCGRCVQACPVVPTAGLAASDPAQIVGGVLATLRDDAPLAGESATWVHQCNGCGACIPACPEGINPRRMVMLASTQHARHDSATPQLFRKMARAIRTMAAMQLVPDDLARLLQPQPARDVDVVFYVGCNAIRTPQILFDAMQVLDALDVDYEIVGGPSACCGIIHTKWQGDLQPGGRVTEATLQRFGDFRPKKVLNWCPSCELHLGETVHGFRTMAFDFDHLTKYLLERESELAARMTTPVPMRVLLHVHEGMAELGRNVERLLRAVPGLTLVDVVAEAGYTCGGSGADRSPALKAKLREVTLQRMREPGIDALVSLFHGCHMQLAAAGKQHGFQVVNFTELLVRAVGGVPRADALEPLRSIDDWHAVAAHVAPRLKANGIDVESAELAGLLPELFALAEFRGGLKQWDVPPRAARQ